MTFHTRDTRFVQIACAATDKRYTAVVFALDAGGRVWKYRGAQDSFDGEETAPPRWVLVTDEREKEEEQ